MTINQEPNNLYDVHIVNSGKMIDNLRSEVNMKYIGLDIEPFDGSTPEIYRELAVQLYIPQSKDSKQKFPIILFSGGLGENYRFYSTILTNLAKSGYIIINVDHYYFQDTEIHTLEFDEKHLKVRERLSRLSDSMKQERFNKTKLRALNVFFKDQLFALNHIYDLLREVHSADYSKMALVAHSLGGNANKKLLEYMTRKKVMHNFKAFISLDSRLNQFGLSLQFQIPSLIIGAWDEYQTNDPMRQLPEQPNLTIDVMDHTTHVCFDDIAIYTVLEKDTEPLKEGLNRLAKAELEYNIAEIKKGNWARFDDKLFLAGKKEMEEFLLKLNIKLVSFLKKHL